ncbi:hypothetical protein TNCV_4555851 [Trichonephila clavipes]|nr:hypothetical protein TNCV_4555851 [Trichonephila clavipes]
MNLTWRNPPAHHWHAIKSLGLSLEYRRSRALQIVLTSFRSSHLHGMTFVQGFKSSFTCPCFSCSSSGLLGHFPEAVVWRSRSGLRNSYAGGSNGLRVGFPALGFEITQQQISFQFREKF